MSTPHPAAAAIRAGVNALRELRAAQEDKNMVTAHDLGGIRGDGSGIGAYFCATGRPCDVCRIKAHNVLEGHSRILIEGDNQRYIGDPKPNNCYAVYAVHVDTLCRPPRATTWKVGDFCVTCIRGAVETARNGLANESAASRTPGIDVLTAMKNARL